MKKAMAYFMQSSSGSLPKHSKDQYTSPDKDIKSWSDEYSGVRPGRNIEDVERDAISHLLRPNTANGVEFEVWKTPLRNIRKRLEANRAPEPVTPEDVIHATASVPTDQTQIDPITNRRVPRKENSSHEASSTQVADAKTKENHESFTSQFENVDRRPNLRSDTLSAESKNVEEFKKNAELKSYKSARWAEPETLQQSDHEKLPQDYDDLPSYGAARWSAADGLRELTPEEKTQEYDELQKYGAVRWNEPDGLRNITPEERSKQYNDLAKYDAVYWNEPDGLREPTPEELSKDYTDLHAYKPVTWNEPDGLRPLTSEEKSKEYDDLALYDGPQTAEQSAIDAFEASQMDTTPKGNPLPPKVEVAAEDPGKDYKDLGKYGPVYWNEPDGLSEMTPEERSRQYGDLHLYRAPMDDVAQSTRHSNPDTVTAAELSKYQYQPNPAERTEQVHPEELTKHYKDLDKYKPRHFDDIGFQAATVKSSAVGGGSRGSASNSGNSEGNNDDSIESMTPDEVRANVLRRARTESQRLKAGESRKFSGNYARDFPEEFSTSWSTTNSPSKSTLFPQNKVDGSVSAEPVLKDDAEASSMDESFPVESAKLEPALNRHARRRTPTLDQAETAAISKDPYTKTPRGLETSFAEETSGGSSWPTTVKHYGQKHSGSARQQAAKKSSEAGDALQYRILAYDPATDSVSTADTSSAVHDASMPLTPADIIPQLSHPAKFFPHFSELQDEGYEIVSGQGDVLVFRQALSASKDYQSKPARARAVNPVDLMGKPVITGNFASPTGFVNYDSLSDEAASKPAPPFRAAPDGRGESTGSSNSQDAELQRRKKRGLGRKMALGTAYVAGGAYAVGVVGEYFGNGGGNQTRRRF